ncbi:stage V sporulation protein AD [Anaerotignum lactatifermentans]|uniref:Stage V sporulation protein AD n=1 Tax=Anaerotignum lactatifermentans TaxID=160404 RepID=A0ABS2G9K7_9FIRM|nr:stage V sporulation protein AD [Anaerotignum lactatifermentans]MBM6829198.1 stage V sporulation protein AD [Anaerotignum lactatifermentans]MBM6877562.1 stage V sporulation protein AD [Anaerotignum lactatifermentans]MBM6950776.1 stage V sporulation protein AD [Anaerotignum lactatifermentans]
MGKRLGPQTVRLEKEIHVVGAAGVAGKMEGEGPLGEYFDRVVIDAMFGEDSWEKAESHFVREAMERAVEKSGHTMGDMNYILCGDLLNQCIGTTFGIKDFSIPCFGVFGACSTMGETMSLGAMLLDGGFAETVLAGASSHFCSAEKQFRFPLPLGIQRPPVSARTVTGAGAVVLSRQGEGPLIREITTGKIVDLGIKDANHMGAAMAPAAAALIAAHLRETGRQVKDYDVIATGDLGHIGRELAIKLLKQEGFLADERYTDCGMLIFDRTRQDVHAGGSGCACSALTFASYFYPRLCRGEIRRMLFVPTGALLSTTSVQQGLSIPGIAHGIVLESGREE